MREKYILFCGHCDTVKTTMTNYVSYSKETADIVHIFLKHHWVNSEGVFKTQEPEAHPEDPMPTISSYSYYLSMKSLIFL